MAGPLEGTRVVELPAIGPVPVACMLLADLGAEVVRVDKPVADGPFDAMRAGPLGRGRRSIRLDVRRPGGAEAVLRLCAAADALIEGFRPGVAERLGIGPDEALARNPRLVYGRVTGWGQDGPLAPTAGHDITYLAISGLLHGIGAADGPPVPPVNYLADFAGGSMFLVAGLLAALLHARETGAGQVIDVAMTEAAAYLGSMTRTLFGTGSWTDERAANLLDGGAPNYRCYECADGRYVAVGALEPKFWSALVATLGLTEVPSPYERAEWPECTARLADAFRQRTRDDWAEVFAQTDACVAPVLTLAEAPSHPQNGSRGTYTAFGAANLATGIPRFSGTPAAAGPVTEVGADTATLLAEAGYSETEIDALRSTGTIA
jgi:alpha-methylacyl-CoA racemase